MWPIIICTLAGFVLGFCAGGVLTIIGVRLGGRMVWRASGQTEPFLESTPDITQESTE